MPKTIFKKQEKKLDKYRDYKKFDSTAFHTALQSKLEEGLEVYQNFQETFVRVLDAYAPRKTKALHGYHKPSVDKNLCKAIMKCSAFKRKTNRTKQEDITKYKKQQNMVVKLNREMKLQYFNNLEISKNSKSFWDKCRPYFSKKHAHSDSKIILIKKEKNITNTNKIVEKETFLGSIGEIAKTFKTLFKKFTSKNSKQDLLHHHCLFHHCLHSFSLINTWEMQGKLEKDYCQIVAKDYCQINKMSHSCQNLFEIIKTQFILNCKKLVFNYKNKTSKLHKQLIKT